MAKCNDCWCEHYYKSKGNCNQCQKKETENEKSNLSVILKQRAVRQMELGRKSKFIGQSR